MEEKQIYRDDSTEKIISQTCWGKMVEVPRGVGSSIEQVAEFNGRTIGEYREQGRHTFDPKDYIWHDFASWLKTHSL